MDAMARTPRGLGRVKTIEDVKADTLIGDVRDLVLQEMRDAKDALPWTVRSEKDQADMIDRADRFSRTIVARIINIVAVADNPHVPVTIKEWKVTDELKIALTGAATLGNLHTMIDGGSIGFLVFADKEPFDGEREPIRPLADQPDLIDIDEDGVVLDDDGADDDSTTTVQFGDGPEIPLGSPAMEEEAKKFFNRNRK